MDTSGLMFFALTVDTHRLLSVQFQKRQVNKKYMALLEGHLKDTGGRIELKFRLDPENRPLQVYDPVEGKAGITEWEDDASRLRIGLRASGNI
jgi:tRNA pseudouridine32 synthase/23S rRNA pseudouridine746 synthase